MSAFMKNVAAQRLADIPRLAELTPASSEEESCE
jgi:hypothetical protein